MNILSMTATFGCLDQATLKLQPGLNLLEMPNESGKSTWCAFIRAMLYGLESRKGGALSERNRYTPWSGAAMSGSMDLVWQGKAITLRRFAKGSNPFGGFQAVYTGTEEPVPGLTADNAGEALLGVTKEVFQRTCFISQGGLWVDASGDLERRVASLASSGEEDVSYSDAEKRLRDWRNQRQSNRATGALPKLRAQLDQVQTQRQRLLDAREKGRQAQRQLEQLEAELAEVGRDLTRHEALVAAQAQADQRARYEAAAQRLADAEDTLAQAQAQEDRVCQAVPPQPGSGWAGRLALSLTLVLGCALMVCAVVFSLWPLALGGLSLLNIGALGTHMLNRARRSAQAAFGKAQEALNAAQAQTQAAQAEHIAARAAWEAISAQGEPPAAVAVEDRPHHSLSDDQLRQRRLTESAGQCRAQLSRSQGEEEALGGLGPMDDQVKDLEERIARQESELAALELALEALDAANASLRARFSPALNEEAGAILSRLTGGKYTALTFTRAFEALAQTPSGARSAQLLSQGTADQTYLALRLALCRLALPETQTPPVVLDDALVCFDDARLSLALEVLGELARERQVLLFTCQSRERLAISGRNPYNDGVIS